MSSRCLCACGLAAGDGAERLRPSRPVVAARKSWETNIVNEDFARSKRCVEED
jgi:hypothetical protein